MASGEIMNLGQGLSLMKRQTEDADALMAKFSKFLVWDQYLGIDEWWGHYCLTS